jgi:hypothetical protein
MQPSVLLRPFPYTIKIHRTEKADGQIIGRILSKAGIAISLSGTQKTHRESGIS